jgi:predicted CoA-binding protein
MSEHSLPPQKFFQKNQTFALVGSSSDKDSHAYHLFLEIEKKGYSVLPLHPIETMVCGVAAFPDLVHIPEATRVIFAADDEETSLLYLRQMRDRGLSMAWFEEGFSTPQMEEFARLNFFEVVKGVNLLETLRKI